ncbi:MAG: ATP-binding protein [Flavobacterium sp.]|jgi:predicted ATPase|nr:ATP-binding protein [Flavobacterium sp.]|tara:strand:- start:5356 stop:5898 length:543 start_codon:yes stop_codon:yes gene_type:complete
MQKKIVLIGGPGTGKSSVLDELERRGFICMSEISREITLEARKKGIEQLFLKEPILFSKLLLEGREKQYIDAITHKSDFVFFDRGIPDIHAYMDFTKKDYPDFFKAKSLKFKYDHVFLFKPWKEIFTSDNERYESFEESIIIDTYLQKSYRELNYMIIEVPFDIIEKRTDFILNQLKKNE